MQKRLAVLTCQLRKAEQEKETFKVATEKLLQFAEVRWLFYYKTQFGINYFVFAPALVSSFPSVALSIRPFFDPSIYICMDPCI